MDSGFVPVPGGSLYFERTGVGPPIVFVHAGIADLTMWEPQVGEFASDHAVVCLDSRGFGRSRTEAVEFSPVDDLRAVLDHLEIARAVLVGCSRGGQHCLDLTVEQPDRVAGLVWVCGGVSGSRHEGSAEQKAIFDRIEALWEAKDWDALVDLETHVWVDGPLQPEGRAPAAVREKVRQMIYAIETRDGTRADAAASLPSRRRPARRGRVPGAGGHRRARHLGHPRLGRPAHRQGRWGRRVDFQDSAHVPSLEHPERFNAALREFLARHSL